MRQTGTNNLTTYYLPALLSALLGIALYAPTIGGTYVYDDLPIIQQDRRIGSPAEWGKFWTQSYNQSVDNLYRPLVSMSYAIQWWINGDRPWAFHLVNVLLHAGVCACVAEFVRRLAGLRAALVVGLLFAAHPIHVEAVANIVGRAELLCALGMFGALVLFLNPLTTGRVLAITGCFLVALLSKEQGMLVPPLLLILGLLRRVSPGPRRSVYLLVILLSWVLAGYVVWREHILPLEWDRSLLDWTINPMAAGPYNPHEGSVGFDRFLMPLVLLGRYTALLVAPIRLSPDYGAAVIGWHVQLTDPYLYLGIFALLAWCIVAAVAIRRRWVACAFACAALGLTCLIVANLLWLIGTIFAERLMYIPSAFFLMILCGAAASVERRLLIGCMTILLGAASMRTVTYAIRWNDPARLYTQATKEQPRSIQLRLLLADEYRRRGELADAERIAAEAREQLPEYWEVWIRSAQIAMEQRRFGEAEEYLRQAGRIRPGGYVDAWRRELARHRSAATTQSAK